MTPSVELLFAKADDIEINKKEALRYMGYTGKTLSEDMEELFSLCLSEFKKSVNYRACFTRTKVELKGESKIDLGFGEFESFHLERNLEGCDEAYIFAATCGTQADRLVLHYSKTEPWKSVVIDAVGSAAVEDWCDIINEKMKEDNELKPRFSCGYGDFKIENQKNILAFLDAYRKIGVSLSDSYIMTPKKTVTAIVGIKRKV